MSTADFIHLHNHTQYSLLDGACRIDPFLELAHDMKMPALAITDHGNMFGAIEFYKKARKRGIKPIIGCEIYVAPKSHTHKEPIAGKPSAGYHMLLLARNETGYKNLMKLVSAGYLEGFYHRPRVDKKLLKEHAEGLIATSACMKGEIPWLLLANDDVEAARAAKKFTDIFGEGNFYLEIQNHGIPKEDEARSKVLALAKRIGLPIVATNDCHYLHQKDSSAHDALLCIQTGKFISDSDRMRYNTDQIYVKTPAEMKELFADYPDAIENTLRIAEMCNLDIELGKNHLPAFPLPEGHSNLDDYLRLLAEDGLKQRYSEITDEHRKRLDFELDVIIKMGYSGYFLIVKDFIDQARRLGVRVGPGRGSAAGSIVSYCLGIVNLDPLKYGLLFERFLNPERISLPDIDIDFADRGRERIIDYVIDKYGKANVCQIITFGTMAARQSIRDVGRVMQVPYSEIDRIAKLIPSGPGQTISGALSTEPELKKLAKGDEESRKLLEFSQTLEGLARHASTHAAGVVIAPKALTEFVPLFRAPKGEETTTQYDMKCIEEIGLLKMDFLGLRTLTVIDDAIAMIKENHGIEIDLEKIPLDDERVFELFCGGHTVGIFQFESSGMQDYLRKLGPENLGDLIAMNALYRPGPLDAGTIDDYIKRKHGEEEVIYDHPKLEPILKETYGVIVYQEQVIKIAMELAGFTAGQGDVLRKAMGKKVVEIMEQQQKTFLDGCAANGVDPKVAAAVFLQIETFARYGFNKSHAAGYSYLAYQTAYLKAHYPREFNAASLTSEMGNTDRVIILIEECRRLGIPVLPPDINSCGAQFTVDGDRIRFGLGAVKNVGLGAIEKIMEAREKDGDFASIFDFVSRVDIKAMNRRVLESLIKAGALDSLPGHRAQLLAAVESVLAFGQARHASKQHENQASLFGADADTIGVVEPALPDETEWDNMTKLSFEEELLGEYISGHPLDSYRTLLSAAATCNTFEAEDYPDDSSVTIGGVLTRIRENTDKKGNRMAFATLRDLSGTIEIIIFSALYATRQDIIKEKSLVMISGRLSKREEEKPKIVADRVESLDTIADGGELTLTLFIEGPNFNGGRLESIEEILGDYPGSAQVILVLDTGNEHVVVEAEGLKASAKPGLTRRLSGLLGSDKVRWEARASAHKNGTTA
ncbi:MAG: DNA polymerase III subunit alpha [candidate division Zixibacteria bacterium]|nr:DNA polymerase III subunit alpha [candidate division Zixibacteria bacterium]MBU1469400.1 DNA polymerase III subunit alpha [candidate division Zixibacteria bacterium]MBU2624154.1 DNA polymerase III subunit alpha [candidate division Zixibacteria bacterium]